MVALMIGDFVLKGKADCLSVLMTDRVESSLHLGKLERPSEPEGSVPATPNDGYCNEKSGCEYGSSSDRQ